jgi:hypothetical protein
MPVKWSRCLLLIALGINLLSCSRNAGSDPSSGSSGGSSDLGSPVTDDGVFSFQGPKGWNPQDDPDRAYPTCIGPAEEGGFKPSIFITSEGNQAVDDYVKSQTEKLSGINSKFKLVDKASFKTDHGETGMRLVVRNESSPRKIESVRYVFAMKNGLLLVFRCQCPSAEDAQFRPIFDASMKSLIFDSN